MNTKEKAKVVEELNDKFKKIKSAVFADFTGLDVAQVTELRKRLRDSSTEFRVVKNSLALRASKGTGLEELSEYFSGPTSIAFSFEDELVPAKVIIDYIKDQPQIKIKGGFIEGKKIESSKLEELAKLPSKEIMISMLLASFQSPLVSLVGTLEGVLRNFIYTLEGIKGLKESK